MEMPQTILITGSSRGLGLEMTKYLLSIGHTVIGLSRSGTEIEEENFIDIVCDIKDEAAVEEMYELIAHHTDRLDTVILNAGVFQMAPIIETSSKEFKDQFETNALGAFHILKHLESYIETHGAHIITIASLASKNGLANMAAYSASKFALFGMIDSVRNEWSHLDLKFSTLLPGAIQTGIWDTISEAENDREMLGQDDFMHVFKMVFHSPKNIQFPELVFLHKNGIYK